MDIHWAVLGKQNEINLQNEQCVIAMFQRGWRGGDLRVFQRSYLSLPSYVISKNSSRLLDPDEKSETTCKTAKCHIYIVDIYIYIVDIYIYI
jgi:hypothetical protein